MGLTISKLIDEYMSYPIRDDIRFGQYMYNKYYSDAGPWPELFYETNIDTAYLLICSRIHTEEQCR